MVERTRQACQYQAPIAFPLRQPPPPTRSVSRRSDESASHLDLSSSISASMMEMPIMTPTINSTPISPAQSNTQHDKTCSSFVPPARPSSTPFSHPENRGVESSSHTGSLSLYHDQVSDARLSATSDGPSNKHPRAVTFEDLPMEVYQGIADQLFGFSISPTSSSAMKIQGLHNGWASALRHTRCRELSNLALINRRWTFLIQQRLYRHIKLKATADSIDNALLHLRSLEHLARHIKHIEIWFPVFQPLPSFTTFYGTIPVTSPGLGNATYYSPINGNCTLEVIFSFMAYALPEVQVLTLEGGERRKAPKVIHYARHGAIEKSPRQLDRVESVRTLVTRGQWNLMRDNNDFDNILRALPNLEEWQGSYSKPKSKSYISLSHYIPSLPINVTRLGICLENDYRREAAAPGFFYKVAAKTHICTSMGQALPRLEHFSYTGRVCYRFFETAARLSDGADSRLKSIDLTVKNCCRDANSETKFNGSGSGIHEMGFIEAFEQLVMSAIRFLEKHERLQYLRIRFVDLDSLLPPLNPYFLLKHQTCTGVWSEAIVAEMARVRPEVSFAELSENFGSIMYSKEGRMVVSHDGCRTRITSLKLSNYQALANRITIH
ncbi:hypothetical protein CDD82_756 [Ophiocordyceps australis]|uniref:Uncharacterized protein n=1 Tax=Ophiocordyceps australis TaxID=1399860 RepID=A0A2C5YL01_9HYPO|nr:hypothetical protein CDD82_756 [Ophiocordyceps australis]